MKCPVDNVDLLISDRQGIEIDYCPKCRGIWLDRGELDKIIERSSSFEQGGRDDTRRDEPRKDEFRRDDYRSGDDYKKYGDKPYKDDYYYKKKKGGFLGELFDFD